MMKNIFLVFVFALSASIAVAQFKKPVTWSYEVARVSAGTYEVKMTANIQPGWHTYSQSTPEGGPVPTSFTFTKNPLITLSGNVKESGKLEQRFEPLFDVDVKQYSNKVVFIQTVKVKGKVNTKLSGVIEFMVCNDRECLPPAEEKFSLALK